MPVEGTHATLVQRAVRWLENQGCGVVFHDGMRAATGSGECPDAIGWRSGQISILVECKVSRADFLSDRKKIVRVFSEMGMGDWRFFLCPPEVILVDDLPVGWGLLYVQGKKIRQVHGVPGNVRWGADQPFKGNKRCEMQMMYSALRRLKIRGCFERIYERLV